MRKRILVQKLIKAQMRAVISKTRRRPRRRREKSSRKISTAGCLGVVGRTEAGHKMITSTW